MYAAAVGSWDASDEKCLLAAASHASTQLHFTSLDDATRRMEEQPEEPRCVFVSQDADLSAVVSKLRERANLLTVPVIAVVTHPSESSFRAVFAAGADDAIVSGDRGGITRRLANLSHAKRPTQATRHLGLAVVASADIELRRTLGKTLRRAGFDVNYASEASDLVELARTTASLSLVVASDDFPPLGADAAISSARSAAQKPSLPALVVPAEGETHWTASGDLPLDSKLMSFADEVARGGAVDQRVSRRLPFGTICSFRPAGVMHPTFCLTHNVSREGLFLRTLDVPKPGTEVWIELRAPEVTRIVHLRGNVIWRREPGAVGATPFGFGMRLKPEACPPEDSAEFIAGYNTLLTGGSSTS
jgi:DNA-binding response OmpR family regulator